MSNNRDTDPEAMTGIVDDNNNLYAVFATEREAMDYLTRHGDDDNGDPFLYAVEMSSDDVASSDAAGAPLPWHTDDPPPPFVVVPRSLVVAAIGAMEYVAEDLRERAEYDDRADDSDTGDNRRESADEYDEDIRALQRILDQRGEVPA